MPSALRAWRRNSLRHLTTALTRVVLGALVASTLAVAQVPPSATAHEGYAQLPGVRIWYKDTGGSGVPVILMHAATGSSQVWEHQIPALTAAGYRVIAYDRRGWGRSVTETGALPGTAADDLQALIDFLRIDRFHLIATAAGASVSLDYAVSFPQRVRSLVIANGALGGLQDEQYQQLSQRIRSAQLDPLPPELRELGPSYRATDPEGTRRWVELEHVSRPAGPPAPAQPTRNRITLRLLETSKVPMLLITGDADLLAPPPLLRFIAARVKNSESVVIPEAGHSAYWEQPEIFNRAVLQFIRKH